MDKLNLFFIGAVIGTIKGKSNKAEEKVKAYEQYYKCTETLLDSLDGTHDLDLSLYKYRWNTFIPSVSGKSYTKINNV